MIASFIVPVLVISGAATAGSIVLVLVPRPMARSLFGVAAEDELTVFLTRYVGLLVFLVGCLTIYSAYHPEVRMPLLLAAILEKLFFGALVVFGGVKRTPILIAAAIADACFAVLYIAYLAGH